MDIYDFTVKRMNGTEVSLSEYRDKVLLIVNSATQCKFTPQYEALQELYDQHADDGFEILDFPCNQFGGMAPGRDSEIFSYCLTRYGVTFPQFSKIDVVGEHADPLFLWLAAHSRFEGFHGPGGMFLSRAVKKMDPDYKRNNLVKWNFTKFLIDPNGEVVARFEPTTHMHTVKKRVELLL